MEDDSPIFTQEYLKDGWAIVVVPEGNHWKVTVVPEGMFGAFTLPTDAKGRNVALSEDTSCVARR